MPVATKQEFSITPDFINEQNASVKKALTADYGHLGEQLKRRGLDIETVTQRVQKFIVAVPSWALGTGGTRFGRFPMGGEPRCLYEKFLDAAQIQSLTGATPNVSMHIPWDIPENINEFKKYAQSLGLGIDAMNSNTFQDQADQKYSYKFGSLIHTDPKVRKQAIDHNIECIEIGKKLGSKALTVWLGDGGNHPGQIHFRRATERYIDSLKQIYKGLPNDWHMYIEHKFFEPAFYSTLLNDWGISYIAANEVGPKTLCLVDLGHHAPNANIEMIVARLIQFRKLAGFHFNDSKYGDDDLTCGSIKPYQLFLIFNELVDAEQDPTVKEFNPAYMIDQSHNIKDPIEELLQTVDELQREFTRALLVNRKVLNEYQENNRVIDAELELKNAYHTDANPIIQMARLRNGAAIDPIEVFRKSGYRKKKMQERPQERQTHSGIV